MQNVKHADGFCILSERWYFYVFRYADDKHGGDRRKHQGADPSPRVHDFRCASTVRLPHAASDAIPSIDNMVILAHMLGVTIDEILVLN